MRERKWESGTAERTVSCNRGMRSCSRFRIGAVCATWPKPWPEMETTRWGMAPASFTEKKVQGRLARSCAETRADRDFLAGDNLQNLTHGSVEKGRCPFP